MPKITPHEAKVIVDTYKKMERNCKQVHDAEFGYVPSRVVELLEDATQLDHNGLVRVTKQCLEERGHHFEYVFRKLHAVFFLMLRGGEQMDRAKKRYRLLLDRVKSGDRSTDQSRFLEFIKTEHSVLFKDS